MADKCYQARFTIAYWVEDACKEMLGLYDRFGVCIPIHDLSVFMESGVEVSLKEVANDRENG